jgi:hypothetical protein
MLQPTWEMSVNHCDRFCNMAGIAQLRATADAAGRSALDGRVNVIRA